MVEHLRLFGQSHDLARSGVQLSRCNVSTHGSLPLLSFPTLGVLHCVSGSAVVLGLVHLSQRVLRAGYGASVLLSRGFCKCFLLILAISAFCTVWSGLHCAGCYSVHRCTGARVGGRVWEGSQRAFWGALGAFWGGGRVGHGGRRKNAHSGSQGVLRRSGRVGRRTA